MEQIDDKAREEAEALLRKIGWDKSDTRQAAIYANMEPAKKITMMLELRGELVRLLKQRLRREHPDFSDQALQQLFLEHIALFREQQ